MRRRVLYVTGGMADIASPKTGGRTGRPRDVDVDRRILASAVELFVRAGWRDFSIDEVARKARVGKASIYLRWKDKEDLLHDALSACFAPWPVQPSNSFRDDLVKLVVAILTELAVDVGWAISRAQSEPGIPLRIAEFCRALIIARVEVVEALIEAAKARGEIARTTPAGLIIEAITGAALGHAGLTLFGGGRQDSEQAEDYAVKLVDFLYPAFAGY